MVSKKDIPKHWEWKKLDNIGEIYSGGTPDRDNESYFGGEIPWLRLKDAKEFYVDSAKENITEKGLNNSSAQLLPKGSVIVSTRATIGRVTVAASKVATNQGFKSVYPNDCVPEFIAYYMKSIEDELNQKGRTTTYAEVNKTQFKNTNIPVPPIEEQKAIVEKLDLIFENIEEIQDAQKHAKDIKESLGTSAYKSIFDDLIANYPIVEVENIADEIKNGGTPKRSEDRYWGGSIPWIKSGELNEGYISSSEEYLTDEGLNEGSAKLMDPGTVLIAMYGATRGKTAILQKEMTTNQAICGVLVNENEIIPKFLQFCMKARKRELVDKGRGGGQDNINQTTIKETKIPVPPLNIQEEVLGRIGNIENALKEEYSLQREEIVETLPSTVLAEAFKGNLVDFGATSESDELGSTEQGINEKQESSFDGEGQQSLGEYR
jgi:type I restriction enzyme S subunit